MCGIAGRVSTAPMPDGALVEQMTARLIHRGPDDHGLLVRPHCALGHRRLSIVDRAGGRQPLANEDGTIWLSYNGEVYNHVALRRELEARGHLFRTRCDTEAIVHAYEDSGPRCVERLRGMFAFAVWDAPRKRLLLARDRVGIKPLYYAATDDELLFASDLRALLLAPGVDRSLDEEALACYLALRYVPAPMTLLRGVRKLPPASALIWELVDGAPRISIERYWDVRELPTLDDTPPTEAEAAARLRELIDECVELRLMSEVPLGSFLSGGIDSTAVTAAMLAADTPRPSRELRTFSVGYEDEGTESELAWASYAATALGTRHRELRVDGETVRAQLPRIVADLDEPVADPACVPLWCLARRVREEVTVVLSGEGADELFAGYAIYRHMMHIERAYHVFPGAGALVGLGALLVERSAPSERLRRAAHLLGQPLPSRYRGVSRAFDDAGLELLLGAGAPGFVGRALQRVLEPLWEATRALSPLRRMLYLDLHVWLPDDLLVKADKMTMASSLELRVPLLDHRLVEHAWSLPDSLKLRGGTGKHLLRRAMRGRVPPSILARPKLGFATPAAGWLRGRLSALTHAALLDRSSLASERFSRRHLERLLREHVEGQADRSPELWALLVLELWAREVSQTSVATNPRAAVEL